MKRQLTVISFMTVLFSAAAPSWAFTSRQISVVPASAATVGVATASLSANVYNVNNTPAGSRIITWSASDPANTSWKMSDQMVKLDWNITDQTGGIQIYTNNKAP